MDATRLLLVEDDPDLLLTTRLVLERQGFTVTTAADGLEALDALAHHSVDAAVVDIVMPRMDGITLTRRIRETPHLRHLPVVLLTARDLPFDQVSGLDAGADELRTPVTALVSATELLGEGEASDLVRQQVRRLRTLVEQLLELSRLEAGTDPTRTEDLDLAVAVRRSLDALPTASATLTSTDPGTVALEQSRLDRIIGNLVTNSARHGAASCHVEVRGRTVTVTDDGPGYPDDIITTGPRRFASRPGGGSGLGLVIAGRQAAALGATLEFTNAPGGGARAVLRFSPPAGSSPA